jgi:type IV secretory pathway VirB2 component (pilin)
MSIQKFFSKLFSHRRIVKMLTISLLVFVVAMPAFAQGGDGIGGVVNNLVKSITDIIQSVAVGAGILGLTFWGIGKVVRPLFPQVSGLTQNYIPDLLIGIAVVLVASQVVESLVASLGGASGV